MEYIVRCDGKFQSNFTPSVHKDKNNKKKLKAKLKENVSWIKVISAEILVFKS